MSREFKTVGLPKQERKNPFRSRIHSAIHDVISVPKDKKEKRDTNYHKAVRTILHHIAISELANNNEEMRNSHKDHALKLKLALPQVRRKHPVTGDELKDAHAQRIKRKNIHHHLAEIERDRF